MEKPDNNPFPEIKLWQPIERLKKIGRWLIDVPETPMHNSDHYVREHFVQPTQRLEIQVPDNVIIGEN